MATCGFSVCRLEGCPHTRRGCRHGDQRLNVLRDRTKECTEDQFILSFPERKGWIWCGYIFGRDGGIWNRRGFVKEVRELIPIKESMNLSTPHEKVGAGKLCKISHVNVEKSGGLETMMVSLCEVGELELPDMVMLNEIFFFLKREEAA